LLQIQLLFSLSLDKKVTQRVSYGPQESQGRFFSQFTVQLSFISGLTERKAQGMVKVCTWISSATEQN